MPGPVVGDLDGDELALGVVAGRDLDLALLADDLQGVVQDVDQHALDLLDVQLDQRRQVHVELDLELDVLVDGGIDGQQLLQYFVDVALAELDLGQAGEVGELLGQVLDRVQLLGDDVQAVLDDGAELFRGLVQAAQDPLRGDLDRGERVLDLVGDALGHLAPDQHALGLDQLGQVGQHHQQPGEAVVDRVAQLGDLDGQVDVLALQLDVDLLLDQLEARLEGLAGSGRGYPGRWSPRSRRRSSCAPPPPRPATACAPPRG